MTDLLSDSTAIDKVSESAAFLFISDALPNHMNYLERTSRTAKLWWQLR